MQAAVAEALASQKAAAPSPAAPEPEPTPAEAEELAAPPSPAATEAPATVDFAMPNLVGANLQVAQNQIQELGVFYSISHDMLGARSQLLDSNWKVCTQNIAPGRRISGPTSEWEGKIDLGAVKLTEDCP